MIRTFLVLLLCLLNVMIWWKAGYFSMMTGVGDFWDARNYLHIIADLKQGKSPYAIEYMQTLGPPLVIVPYIPLSYFSEKLALQIFTVVSLLAGYGACCLLVMHCFGNRNVFTRTLLLSGILFSAFPTRFNFITGQWGVVGLLLVTLFLSSKSSRVKGIALGLLMTWKTYFIYIISGLFKSHRSVIAYAAATVVVVFLLCLPLLKFSYYVEYRQKFAGVMWQPDRVVDLAYYNQSLKTTLSRFGLVSWSVPLWMVCAFITTIYLYRSQNWLAAIVFSLVLSPVAWQHYYVVLFPLLVITLKKIITKPKWLSVWVLAVILWWIEFPWLHGLPLSWWTSILASHYLLSTVLLSCILVYNHQYDA